MRDTENAYVFVNGDVGNFAIKGKVSDTYGEVLKPDLQIDKAVELFTPIKDKILIWNDGNHEGRVYDTDGIHIGKRVCRELGIENVYSGEGAFLKVCLGKDSHSKRVVNTFYVTHGWGGGKKPGGKLNNITDLAGIIFADCYVFGHVHEPMTYVRTFLMPDLHNDTIQVTKQLFVVAGGWMDYGGYGQAKGYHPAKIGSPRIRLDGRRKDLHASI